jgi:hypothetical protein
MEEKLKNLTKQILREGYVFLLLFNKTNPPGRLEKK